MNKFFIFLIFIITTIFSKDIESMNFSVYFNTIKAGDASLILSQDAKEENYIINFELKSKKYLDAIYKLRERTSILINKNDFSIYEIEKNTRQGRHKKSYSAQFDYDKKIARLNKKILTFEDPIYDPINIIYYVRNNLDSLKNNSFSFNVISKNKFKTVVMHIIKGETITFNNSEYDCIVIGPENSDRLKNEDDIKIWITDDELNMPLMIEKKAKYGIIKMKLENYEK